jgi:hypothetical protein
MAALARLGPETAAAVALGGTVRLGELLTVGRSFAPAALLLKTKKYFLKINIKNII